MMNFETLSLEAITQRVQDLTQDALLFQTKALVDKERELTAKTLVLFREIERRRLHLAKGYASLFDLLVHYFGLSEGSASRRVASVRLMTQVPEIEKKISDGELTLSTVAAAQRFFNAEARNDHPLKLDEKKDVLESLEGMSVREVEKELAQRSSVPIALQVPDQVKPKGDEHVVIRFLAPQALADLLAEAKGLLAHRLSSGATLAEVIQALAEMGVEKIKKERFGVGSKPKGRAGKVGVDKEGPTNVGVDREGPSKTGADEEGPIKAGADKEGPSKTGAKKEVSKVDVKKINPVRIETAPLVSADKSNICAEEKLGAERKASDGPKVRSRHISMAVRRAVYTRANGKCESVNEATGQRCGSAAFLELHHQLAFAKGGEHTVDQIKLCCRSHNGFYAEVDFSSEWMAQFRSR